MSMNGDYRSLAEAVGEAPPQTGITGSEFDEILHNCGDDYDEAIYLVGEIDRRQMRDYEAWHREHPQHDSRSFDAGYRQALIDNDIDPDSGPPPGVD